MRACYDCHFNVPDTEAILIARVAITVIDSTDLKLRSILSASANGVIHCYKTSPYTYQHRIGQKATEAPWGPNPAATLLIKCS